MRFYRNFLFFPVYFEFGLFLTDFTKKRKGKGLFSFIIASRKIIPFDLQQILRNDTTNKLAANMLVLGYFL